MRILIAAALAAMAANAADAGVLDRVRQSGTLTLGYRADAKPFSYKTGSRQPGGYSVELCRAVAADVKSKLGLNDLKLRFSEVTAENRLEAPVKADVDLLCGSETETLSRRAIVDFSLMTFVTGM